MKQQEKETLKAIEDFKNIIDSSWKTGRYILSTDKVEQLRVLIIKAYKAGYAVETMNTKPERDKVMDKFNEIFPDVKRIPNPVIRKSRTTETTPKYIEEFKKEQLKLWKRINKGRITGSLSGRHLIIEDDDLESAGDQYDDPTYHYLDEWIMEFNERWLSKTIESERERVKKESVEWINNNKRTIEEELGRSEIIYVADIKKYLYLK